LYTAITVAATSERATMPIATTSTSGVDSGAGSAMARWMDGKTSRMLIGRAATVSTGLTTTHRCLNRPQFVPSERTTPVRTTPIAPGGTAFFNSSFLMGRPHQVTDEVQIQHSLEVAVEVVSRHEIVNRAVAERGEAPRLRPHHRPALHIDLRLSKLQTGSGDRRLVR
jgi:hypothetical protein